MARDLADHIAIKGIKDGLLVSVEPDSPWAEVIGDLAARIDEQAAFFQGARIAVNLGERAVRSTGLFDLRNALAEREVSLWAVLSENAATVEAARLLGLETNLSAGRLQDAPPEFEELEPIDTEFTGGAGVLVKRTLRSGSAVRHAGHVVVIGDVNPGAEIVAGGDVVVWGRLRGMVHAGANGDERAVICALDLAPTQLRIASHIAIAPAEKSRNPKPEVAFVRDGRIMAELWE
ncbi:MAG: septum site-determining protein MinC [Anaerolineae bacterium]